MATPEKARTMDQLLPFRRFAWLLSSQQNMEVDRFVAASVGDYMRANAAERLSPAIADGHVPAGTASTAASSSSASAIVVSSAVVPGETPTKDAQAKDRMIAKKRSLLALLQNE